MQHFKLLVIATSVIILLFGISQAMVVIKEQADGIILECPNSKEWEKNGRMMDNGNVKLTKLSDSDTGEYTCINGHERSSAYVFVRLCRNCVELDASTISGIVVGDIIATIFIAVAIYCVSSSNMGKDYRTSDKQSLVPHDHNDLYQDLGKRRASCEYSELAPRLKI